VRLTLLNKGATDGLVRHLGWISYGGIWHRLSRAAPPSEGVISNAVPVFQTNKTPPDFASQSVGKVPQDSMVDLWYRFSIGDRTTADRPRLCSPGETIKVRLFDQNNVYISGTLECNQEN
jgi:hypothetical protein